MADDPKTEGPPPPNRPRAPIPNGYRQGIINAITVVLAFSLLFVRYWNFELPGPWRLSSTIAAILTSVAIILELFSLWRALQIKDDDETEYTRTLRWFLASVIVLLVSLAISGLSFTEVIKF
jgi:hypothetical protein